MSKSDRSIPDLHHGRPTPTQLDWSSPAEALKLWSFFANLPINQALHYLTPSEQDFDTALLQL